jgi:hypothetical protein
MTPSSRRACHIPAAWALVWMLEERLNSQSTSSVPGAHLLTSLPDTFLSLRHVFCERSKVLNAHPVLPIIVLGDSVIGSAGFGWSGDIDRLGGGDRGCCIPPPFVPLTAVPNPFFSLQLDTKSFISSLFFFAKNFATSPSSKVDELNLSQ